MAKTKIRLGNKSVARPKASNISYTQKELRDLLPSGLVRAHVNSRLETAADEIEEVGLEAPEEYQGRMPQLPNDIASCDPAELSNLLAEFQNAHSTATWRMSIFYIQHSTYEEIADYLEARAIIDGHESNDTRRKAAARTQDDVVHFRSLRVDSYNSYIKWRDLAKSLEGKAKTVSRVGGFLGDERQSADLTGKGTTRSSQSRRSRRTRMEE